MTRKFRVGEIVRIKKAYLKRNPNEKKLIGIYGRIIYTAEIESHMIVQLIRKHDRGFNKLFYRDEISHVPKEIKENFIAKELAEKL